MGPLRLSHNSTPIEGPSTGVRIVSLIAGKVEVQLSNVFGLKGSRFQLENEIAVETHMVKSRSM